MNRRDMTITATVASAAVAIGIGLFVISGRYEIGFQVFDENEMPDVRAIVDTLIDGYNSIAALVTTSFGAVAFLVAYRQKSGIQVSSRAWALLAAGIVFLVGALILTLLGREYLFIMLSRNAVQFGLPVLYYGRWATYGCVVMAAIFVSFFAVESTTADAPAAE